MSTKEKMFAVMALEYTLVNEYDITFMTDEQREFIRKLITKEIDVTTAVVTEEQQARMIQGLGSLGAKLVEEIQTEENE